MSDDQGFGGDQGSVPDDDGRGPVFHYNRAKRLARAPESVQKAYEEGYTPNKGFIKGLTANPGLRSLLFVIVLLCVMIMGISIFGDVNGTSMIGGTEFQLKAFPFDEAIYVSTTLRAREDFDGEPVPIVLVIKGINAEGAVVAEKELAAVYTGRELPIRGIIQDYEIDRVLALVKYGKTDGRISVTVDRK